MLSTCAPKAKSDGICMDDSALESSIASVNAFIVKHRSHRPKLSTGLSRSDKIKQLREYFSMCSNDECWLESPELKSGSDYAKLAGWFAPKTIGAFEGALWGTDLTNVMAQYEEARRDFKYLGTHPFDFLELNPMLPMTIYKYILGGMKYIGMCINYDTHDKKGSHWVGLFFDFNKNIGSFFDSGGKCPAPDPIIKFILKVQEFSPELRIACNPTRHQFGGNNCGVYALHFIRTMLSGKSLEYFIENVIDETEIRKLKMQLFRK
jgi:hypothetical protein